MERVNFTFKNGHVRPMAKRQAELLGKAGFGTYQTRDMAAQPMIMKPMQAMEPVKVQEPEEQQPAGDALDALNREQLHDLAKERGIQVHHRAGADTVRAALRGAAQ
jgi:hypothetical protein